METVLFYLFAALAVAGALLVVVHKNPVSSAVSLVLTLFSTAVLFVLLSAHFAAAIQVLVYAGAIMVLFLFTVMFLNLGPGALNFDSRNMAFKGSLLLAGLFFVGYFAILAYSMAFPGGSPAATPEGFGTVEGVGMMLFTEYLLPFELTSVLILAAIIGVVAIARGGRADMGGISPEHYFVLSAILFVIGAFGVIARKNLIIVLMSLELMLNAANLAFIAFSRVHGDMTGHVFMIMSITVAAAEVAVGLALVVAVYSHRDTLNIDVLKMLKG